MSTAQIQSTYTRIRSNFYVMLAILTAIFSGAVIYNSQQGVRASIEPAVVVGNGAAAAFQNSYAGVVSRVAPAVVTVRSERRAQASGQNPLMNDPRFREFFGDRFPQQRRVPEGRQRGLGSGVIVSSDGYILTNHHVIDGAERIRVQLTDNRAFDAKVIGSDSPSDLAVLKIEAQNLPVLPLGDSDRVQVGDVALAVGNPLGIGQTVTSGIISAKGRSTGFSDGNYEDFIQTDAPINQGNSGGALVNTNGELIGINSQILSPSGGNIGIGFAIPSNMAKNVMGQLVASGKVRRGVLGVTVQPVTTEIAQSLGIREANGVIVSSVQPGSAAAQAGIQQGDVITKLNGTQVADGNAFRNRIAGAQPNTDVTLTVARDGREQELRVTLRERTEEIAKAGNATENEEAQGAQSGKLGVRVEPLTPQSARELQTGNVSSGLVVRDLDANGPAAEAGIRGGDVIVAVNRQNVRTVDDLRAALERTGNRPALMLVNRGGNNLFITVQPNA